MINKYEMKNRFDDNPIIYAVLAVLWAGVIYIGSSIPGSNLPSAPDVTSSVVHVTEYAILSILIMQAFWKYYGKFVILDTAILVVLYAISDEVHQYFVPGRFTDPVDLAFDILGLTLGMLIFVVLHIKYAKRG